MIESMIERRNFFEIQGFSPKENSLKTRDPRNVVPSFGDQQISPRFVQSQIKLVGFLTTTLD